MLGTVYSFIGKPSLGKQKNKLEVTWIKGFNSAVRFLENQGSYLV